MRLMDGRTCAKNLRSLIYTKSSMGVGNIFSREGGNSRFFQVVAKGIFQGGPTVVKFHYTNSKESDKHFSTKTLIGKYQISNSVGGLLSRFFVC